VFESLDFVYVATDDVDATARRYADELGAEPVWKVRGMGTVVACLRISDAGPHILLSGHLPPGPPILVYRVADYAATVAGLRAAGLAVHELEIPHGPCARVDAPGGQPYAVYEVTRPHNVNRFDGRFDEPV